MAEILIIEDNLMHLDMTSELLGNAGYKILKATGAEEGIRLAKLKKPDLILMDLNLSDVDGFEATINLKKDQETSHIPVVAVSALVMENDKEKAIESGCLGFISKPIEISKFSEIVEEYLDPSLIVKKSKIKRRKQLKLLSNQHFQEEKTKEDTKNETYKILIIDDNPMNAELLKEALEQIGQKSIIAYSGKSALELAKKEKINLILLDVMMPEMSGYEVIGHLKANPKTAEIPVIFISALNEIKDIVKGLNLGSYGYITKPYNIEELKARILGTLRIKSLQDQLKAEKDKLDNIFKFSADGIVLLNPSFEITSCSEQFIKWVDLPEIEIIGKNYCEIMKCNYPNDTKTHFLENCYDSFINEIEIDNNGEKIYLQTNCSKINNFEQELEGYIIVLRDISAYKEMEKQKDTFIATLTHDLKTPVRAEITALELLLKGSFGKLSPEQENIIKETLYSSKFMFNMTDTLLSKYRYDNGRVVLNKDEVDINRLIKDNYKELKYLVEDKNQQITFDFADKKLMVFVDPIEIKRVITNLLSNAINYTPENGKIIIKSSISDNEAKISFIDNGKGISKEDISRIFNKYITGTKKFRQVGTGLGLYVTRQILDAHGGTISVQSEEGKGSTFTFSLPLIPALVN